MSASNQTATRGTRVPDEVRPKIPLQYGWRPKLAVRERYGDEWERSTYVLQELPDAAAEAYLRFTGVPEKIKGLNGDNPWIPGDAADYPDFGDADPTIWMCDECAERDDEYGDRGYLTQQAACKVTEYRSPSCSHTWEEECHLGGGLGLEWDGPEPWGAEILLNGGNQASTGTARDRTLVISLMEDWDYTAEAVAETEVALPDEGEARIKGETGGKEWTADVTVHDGTATVEWRRELPDGETLEGQTETRIRERECNGSSFTKVYPASKARDGDYLPLHEMDAADFPNHASHFGRMMNRMSEGYTGKEMTEAVADAIMEFYRER